MVGIVERRYQYGTSRRSVSQVDSETSLLDQFLSTDVGLLGVGIGLSVLRFAAESFCFGTSIGRFV